MGEELIREVYIRAYNFTSMMFAGYNRLSYISMMYAEEVKKRVLRITLVQAVFTQHFPNSPVRQFWKQSRQLKSTEQSFLTT